MAVREGGEEREKVIAAQATAMSGGGGGGGRRTTRGHPLLRGGWKRERYTHGMHPAQMEALRAMCGALIPSLSADADAGRGDPPGGKDLERFYLASAADSTIPDEVTTPNEPTIKLNNHTCMRTVPSWLVYC
jgi:long-chain-alcohol oxidase